MWRVAREWIRSLSARPKPIGKCTVRRIAYTTRVHYLAHGLPINRAAAGHADCAAAHSWAARWRPSSRAALVRAPGRQGSRLVRPPQRGEEDRRLGKLLRGDARMAAAWESIAPWSSCQTPKDDHLRCSDSCAERPQSRSSIAEARLRYAAGRSRQRKVDITVGY